MGIGADSEMAARGGEISRLPFPSPFLPSFPQWRQSEFKAIFPSRGREIRAEARGPNGVGFLVKGQRAPPTS